VIRALSRIASSQSACVQMRPFGAATILRCCAETSKAQRSLLMAISDFPPIAIGRTLVRHHYVASYSQCLFSSVRTSCKKSTTSFSTITVGIGLLFGQLRQIRFSRKSPDFVRVFSGYHTRAEVAVHELQSYCVAMILYFLAQ